MKWHTEKSNDKNRTDSLYQIDWWIYRLSRGMISKWIMHIHLQWSEWRLNTENKKKTNEQTNYEDKKKNENKRNETKNKNWTGIKKWIQRTNKRLNEWITKIKRKMNSLKFVQRCVSSGFRHYVKQFSAITGRQHGKKDD